MRVLALAALLALLAAGLVATTPVAAQAPTVIRVVTVPIDAGAEVYYAKENGFFSQAGLDVDITTATNGGAAAAAVAGNAVDIGYADTVSISSGFGHGVPFLIVAPAALHVPSAPYTLLVVPKDSPIHTAKDLDGKIVAGSGLGTISGFAPRAWIEQNGGDLSTVKFVELAFPAMQAALDAGRIDAAAITEPFLTAALKTDRAIGSPYDAVSKELLVSAYFTTSGWAKDHPDALGRFIAAIHQAAVWANANHAKSAAILLEYAKIDPALVAQMTRVRYGETLQARQIQPAIDVAAKYGNFASFPAAQIMYHR